MFDITMDGRTIAVEEGATLLDAARSAGIHIPTLCYLKNVSNIGSCRLCVVEVEGVSGLVSSCNTLAHPGMVVKTRSEAIDRARRTALQLIIAEHGLNSTQYCFSCTKNGSCELQHRCRELGVETSPFKITPASGEILDSNPFIAFNPSLCIRCQRCVGAPGTTRWSPARRAFARRSSRPSAGTGRARTANPAAPAPRPARRAPSR